MNMLETSANGPFVSGKVALVHAVGMHARPAVKLTKLAKRFQAQISIRASATADWINAKSVAKVMALRAPPNSTIEIKAFGEDADAAVAALIELVSADFPDRDP
jgi:phosphocarrier protein HPr